MERHIDNVLSMLNIEEYRNFKVHKLSGGNKRKLSLAISIIGKPKFLFLDEPTSSLDPSSRKDIWNLILNLKEDREMISILTTHHLEEAEVLADNISILSFGEIKVTGSVEHIKKDFGVGFSIEIFEKSFKDFDKQYYEKIILDL